MPRNKVKKSIKTTRESDESPVHRNSDRSDNEPQAPENRKITSRASSASVPADIEQRVADALADAQGNTWRGLICAVNGVPVESNPVQVWRLIPSALEEDTESQTLFIAPTYNDDVNLRSKNWNGHGTWPSKVWI